MAIKVQQSLVALMCCLCTKNSGCRVTYKCSS